MSQSTPGESGTEVEANEEEETPAASLTAVDEHANNDANTLAWEGFMNPAEDPCNLNVVIVVVEETEVEATSPPCSSDSNGEKEERKMNTDAFPYLSEIYPHSFRRYKEGYLSDLMNFGVWLK